MVERGRDIFIESKVLRGSECDSQYALRIRICDYPITGPCLELGHHLMLEVKDTGCGIDKSDLDNIFELYFTTKKKGGGHGPGTCHGAQYRFRALMDSIFYYFPLKRPFGNYKYS